MEAAILSLQQQVSDLKSQQNNHVANVAGALSGFGSQLASIQAVVNAIPGAADLEGSVTGFVHDRLAALEAWAGNLGHGSHNAFQPPAAPEPAAETKVAQ